MRYRSISFARKYAVRIVRRIFRAAPVPESWKNLMRMIVIRFIIHPPDLTEPFSYSDWLHLYQQLTPRDYKTIKARIDEMERKARISIVMPVYNTPEAFLRAALDSICNQIYPEWELCIADDASPQPHVREILREYEAREERIKVAYREENGQIAAASNTALELVSGDFVAFMDHDDEIPVHALFMVAKELNDFPETDFIYTDEDKIDAHGKRHEPALKSDWNPDLLCSHNYVGHLSIYRTEILRTIGGLRLGFDGSQDYDFLLRFTQQIAPERIRHIPYILYHWRAIPGSVALDGGEKDYAHENGRNALRAHFESKGISVIVKEAVPQYNHRVIFPRPNPEPLVSLIIPTRDRADLLRQCLDGILRRTDYGAVEVIVMDNQSVESETEDYFNEVQQDDRVRVVSFDRPFNFSAINNEGVKHSKGQILGFLNNDINVIHSDWLTEMVSHVIRPGIGIVGAKLYYASDRIQHAGVVAELQGILHLHKHLARGNPGYCGRAIHLQNLSAVTGACMLTRRGVFDEAGGFDENLPLSFNDVEFCIRIREMGLRILWTPYAELYHLESESRGPDDTREGLHRLEMDARYLSGKLGEAFVRDPYYNPFLTLARGDSGLAVPPRVIPPWRQI